MPLVSIVLSTASTFRTALTSLDCDRILRLFGLATSSWNFIERRSRVTANGTFQSISWRSLDDVAKLWANNKVWHRRHIRINDLWELCSGRSIIQSDTPLRNQSFSSCTPSVKTIESDTKSPANPHYAVAWAGSRTNMVRFVVKLYYFLSDFIICQYLHQSVCVFSAGYISERIFPIYNT